MTTRATHLFATECRRWDCPQCGQQKRRHLIYRITKARPTKMITLTCRHEHDPQKQLNIITKALPRLITHLRQTTKQPIEYLRITERCNDTYPHFHLLARCPFIPQKDLSNKWEALTNAKVVDIRVAHGRSRRYVTKYVAKAVTEQGTWSRQNISVSRHFWIKDDPTETNWLNWEHKQIPVRETALQLIQTHAINRVRRALYELDERHPGDDIPDELQYCPTS